MRTNDLLVAVGCRPTTDAITFRLLRDIGMKMSCYSKLSLPVDRSVLGGLGQFRYDHIVRESVSGDVDDAAGRHLALHEPAGVGRGQVGADESAVVRGQVFYTVCFRSM